VTTYRVVTTCHEKGWKDYGKRMVKSFLHYWPADVRFTLYAEGFTPDIPLKDVRPLPGWQQEFKRRHAGIPKHNGVLPDRPYQLLYDAVRFSHKVGAMVATCVESEADVVIWIDADTVTHSPVSKHFLDSLMKPDSTIAWLNRAHKYPECGFVMFNQQHPLTDRLIADWFLLYQTDSLFKLQHWTDCHSLEHVVKELEAPWSSLSGRYANSGHPFINGPLGSVMDHLKGNRKHEGKSRRMDLRIRRAEPYWRNTR